VDADENSRQAATPRDGNFAARRILLRQAVSSAVLGEEPPMSTPNPYAPPLANLDARPADQPTSMLATRSSRLGASILDGLLYAAAMIVPAIGAVLSAAAMRPEGRDAATGDPPHAIHGGAWISAGTVMMIVGGLGFLALLVFQAFRVSTTGQTLGKKWLAIRIVRMDEAPVDFVSGFLLRSMLPWFLGLIPLVGGIFGLADLLFIFGEQKRCIHDLIAGTKVVTT
jgi:uncharacterized RDD family membrane protein YckC